MKEPQFEAFVTNLNLYNGGLLEGKWLALPASPERIRETLEEIGVAEGKNEYFFTDYDFSESPFLQDILGEFENIKELNTLSTLLADHEADKEKIEGYVNKADCRSIKEICNVIVQADHIEYAPYEFEGMEYLKEQDASAELLYGYTLAEKNGIYQQLQKMDMTNYVDYESYGRDVAINGNIELLKNGYLDTEACNVDLEAYSMQELMKEAGLEKEKTPIEKAPRL